MFWFNKRHPNALFIDNRVAPRGHVEARPNHEVNPDMVMDFRELKFPDKSFKLVVFDPPHLVSLGAKSWMAKKYGVLSKSTWQDDLKRGFEECWRVLADYGVLIFKWSEEGEGKSRSKPLSQLLALFGRQPLFGHTTGSKSNTHWMCFMKMPEDESGETVVI